MKKGEMKWEGEFKLNKKLVRASFIKNGDRTSLTRASRE